MKVEMVTRSEAEQEECDFRDEVIIKIDGVQKFQVQDGEPEDSNLSRDFSDCYSIVELMELAHAAGKAGETFEEL
jgi:hypothetical protein